MKTILVDAGGTFVLKDTGINNDLFALLEQYPNNKIILTNAADDQLSSYGLVNLPYPLFSLKHNPDKSDPEYFRKMLAHYNLDVNDVVYFEHGIEAVKSAESVGITSHFYDAALKDLVGLKAFLDKNL